MIFSMQFPTSDSTFLDLGLGHAALALADLGQAVLDPGEERGGGDVGGVVGGSLVVVSLVVGPDAVGCHVTLEDHRSDCEHIFDEF